MSLGNALADQAAKVAALSVLRTVDMVALSPPILPQEHMLQTLQTFQQRWIFSIGIHKVWK